MRIKFWTRPVAAAKGASDIFGIVVLFGLALGLAAVTNWSFAHAEEEVEASRPAIAFAARVVGDSNRTRILVDFDREVDASLLLRNEPNRVLIDLGHTLFSLGGDVGTPESSLIGSVRYGAIAPRKSRIVLMLGAHAVIEKHTLEAVDSGKRFRLIIDLTAANRSQFAEAVEASLAESGEIVNREGAVAYKGERVVQARPADSHFSIVIDPGHGGIDGGAVGQHHVVEKDITLAFARSLKAALAKERVFDVRLTRTSDVFVSLDDRISLARQQQADLLISIHADSLRQKSIRGATIYTLSEEGSDELSRELADEQNRADLLAGLKLPEIGKGASDILIDLTRRETEAFSLLFAKEVVGTLEPKVRLIKNPLRSADFHVLRAPDIPSVLIELGYLSNSTDEKLMSSPEWRKQTSALLAEAVRSFFAPRLPSAKESKSVADQ